MPGHAPLLDDDALAALRRLVLNNRHKSQTLPMADLVGLAGGGKFDGAVTIDFQATRELGAPLVVVQPPLGTAASATLAGLSRRENEVAALIAQGLSNKLIARRLFLALATVKDHVHRILAKTGLPNRAALAGVYRDAVHRSTTSPPQT